MGLRHKNPSSVQCLVCKVNGVFDLFKRDCPMLEVFSIVHKLLFLSTPDVSSCTCYAVVFHRAAALQMHVDYIP